MGVLHNVVQKVYEHSAGILEEERWVLTEESHLLISVLRRPSIISPLNDDEPYVIFMSERKEMLKCIWACVQPVDKKGWNNHIQALK